MTSIKGGRGTLYYHCLVGTAFKFFLSSKIDFITPPPHKHTYTTRLSNGSVRLLGNHNPKARLAGHSRWRLTFHSPSVTPSCPSGVRQ